MALLGTTTGWERIMVDTVGGVRLRKAREHRTLAGIWKNGYTNAVRVPSQQSLDSSSRRAEVEAAAGIHLDAISSNKKLAIQSIRHDWFTGNYDEDRKLVEASSSIDLASSALTEHKRAALLYQFDKDLIAHKHHFAESELTGQNRLFHKALALALRQAEPAPKKLIKGSWLSDTTIKPVVEEIRKASAEDTDYDLVAIKMVRDAVLGLMNTLAIAAAHAEGQETILIASLGRFEGAIARAILYRVPVEFYEERPFIESLYEDFLRAVHSQLLKSERWTLRNAEDQSLRLEIIARKTASTDTNRGWNKARAVRFSDLKR